MSILKEHVMNEASGKIPSNPLGTPCVVQAYFKNGFKDKLVKHQYYFDKLKDASDFIMKESNCYADFTSPSFDTVTKLLTNQGAEEVMGKYFQPGEGVDMEKYCSDNGIKEVPVPFIAQFLSNNCPVSNFISGVYIPSLKKFVFGKKAY
jgi:hypothetical protein